MHADLQCQANDARSRNCFDLLSNYTREEIETEYILDCLYAELQAQNEPYIQDVLTTSVLEFISKIAHRSEAYTTEAYRRKLDMFQGLEDDQPAFSDIIDGFLDEDHDKVLRIANSMLFRKIPPGAQGLPRVHGPGKLLGWPSKPYGLTQYVVTKGGWAT